MEGDPPLLDSELLGEIRWLRRLAGALVLDAASADDLVQQALLQALERRDGRHAAPLATPRAWLRVVLRHGAARLLRTEHRRAVRESRAAPPPLPEPPDELVARAELHHRVTTTLLALDEPYRHALLLRYLDDLSPPQIAERLALPLETVRTRLKRGLRLLRERLNVESRPDASGSHSHLALALFSLVAPAERAAMHAAVRAGVPVATAASGTTGMAAVAGVALMTLKTKWAIATAGVLVVAAATWFAWPHLANHSPRGAANGSSDPLLEAATASPPRRTDPAPPTASRVAVAPNAAPTRADAEPQPAGDAATPVRGRVVDERRRPVAGATVQLSITDRLALVARTDAAGGFELQVPSLESLDVSARGGWFASIAGGVAPDGLARAGARSWFHFWERAAREPLRPESLEQPLVIRPARPLRVEVQVDGAAAPGALVRLELGADRERGPEAHCDHDGVALFAAVPSGPLLVLARTEAAGEPRRGRALLDFGHDASGEIVVELRLLRRVAITVRDVASDSPIAGAHVGAIEYANWYEPSSRTYPEERDLPLLADSASATTDSEGRAELRLEEQVAYVACASAEDCTNVWSAERSSSAPTAAGGEALSLFLARRRPETLRWKLDPASTRPPDGSELRLIGTWLGHGGRVASARVEGDSIEVGVEIGNNERAADFQAYAVAPDGSIVLLVGRQSQELQAGNTIAFLPGRRLSIELRSAVGMPLAHRVVTVVPATRSLEVQSDLGWHARTDEEGRVHFDTLPAGPASVKVDPEGGGLPWLPIGEVDLTQRDGSLAVTAPAPIAVQLDITTGGVPTLPADLRIESRDLRALRQEDPAAGRVTLFIPSADRLPAAVRAQRLPIGLFAPGFAPHQLSIPLPTEGGEPQRYAVELAPETELIVQFLCRPDAVLRPTLERYDERRSTFESLRSTPERIQAANAGSGRYRFVGLAAGRYRIVEGVSRVTSSEVVLASGERREFAVDLLQTFEVAGTIELPSDANAAELYLRVVAQEPTRSFDPCSPRARDGVEVWHDGRQFRETLERGQRWWLVAWLPFHRLTGGAVAIELDAHHPTVALRFEESPVARFLVRGLEEDDRGRVTVECFEPGNREFPIASRPSRVNGATREVALPIGVHDLVFRSPARVPVVLREVEFAGQSLDLGTIDFVRGSTLTVRLRAPGTLNPIGFVRARRLGDAPDDRWFEIGGEVCSGSVREVAGLSAGTWRVEFVPTDDFPQWNTLLEKGALERSIEIDANRAVEVTLGE